MRRVCARVRVTSHHHRRVPTPPGGHWTHPGRCGGECCVIMCFVGRSVFPLYFLHFNARASALVCVLARQSSTESWKIAVGDCRAWRGCFLAYTERLGTQGPRPRRQKNYKLRRTMALEMLQLYLARGRSSIGRTQLHGVRSHHILPGSARGAYNKDGRLWLTETPSSKAPSRGGR